MLLLKQVDDPQAHDEASYEVSADEEGSPKKGKKKRDASSLRKAPQGKLESIHVT
jgi:hypothetical protein